jgi:S1-C subfamily serine protease
VLKQDHYALLGIPREAETEAIERACAGALSVTSDSAERARLRHARDTLCSPVRRAAYDRSLRTIPTPPRGISGRTRPPLKQATPGAHGTLATKPEARAGWLWLGGLAAVALLSGVLSYAFLFAKPKAASALMVEAAAPVQGKSPSSTARTTAHSAPEARRQAAASNPASGANLEPATAYANAAPSVLLIESLNSSGAVANRGSAVVVGHELVVTNCHTVQYAAAVRVRAGSSEYTAMPDIADNPLDLCLLRVPGLTAPAALRSSLQQVQVGQTVFAMGASPGQERTVTRGQVSALRETVGTTLIQTSATISSGASGGGLFDGEGRLIGITTHQHKLGPNQNLAMPVDLLNKLRNR